ncbi:MAG: hypothetical protein CMJ75_18750 [Planctomycetaceae bacterium]|nr:hypothetical protein [Planctomycetaceae bacterium]
MAKASATKEIEKKEPAGELAGFDYGADAGAGYENVGQDEFSIPFISLLQSGSPQVKGANKIEGASEGMLFNTVTGEVFDTIEFIPAYRTKEMVEWIPRDKGGGYVGSYPMDDPVVEKAKANAGGSRDLKTDAGNDLVETVYLYGIHLSDGGPVPIVISFTSTKLKVWRNIVTQLNMFQIPQGDRRINPPLFAHRLKLGSKDESNPKGDFSNFTIEPAEGSVRESLVDPASAEYTVARDLVDLVKSGAGRAATETLTPEGGDEDEVDAGY